MPNVPKNTVNTTVKIAHTAKTVWVFICSSPPFFMKLIVVGDGKLFIYSLNKINCITVK